MSTEALMRDLRPVVPSILLSISGLEIVLHDFVEGDDFSGDARFGDGARKFFRDEGIQFEFEEALYSLLLVPEGVGSKLLLVRKNVEEKPAEIEVWIIPGELFPLREEGEPLQLAPGISSSPETEFCDGTDVDFALLVDGLYVDLSEQSRLHQASLNNSRYARGDEVTFW